MFIRLKVSIFNESGIPIMGPGPFHLLEQIKKHKSINQAAKSMNLSYVKALSMLNRLERNLDHKILIRKRGGNDRGGAALTPFAEQYIDQYRELEDKIGKFAEDAFDLFLKAVERPEEE